MKLTNRRLLGRYFNPETHRPVNVYKARKAGYGTDVRFFIRSGKRVIIQESDFHALWIDARLVGGVVDVPAGYKRFTGPGWSADVLPCPFCGEKDNLLVYHDTPNQDCKPWLHVVCRSCSGSAPTVDSWNRRTGTVGDNCVPAGIAEKTFAVQHNPNCPKPFLVRLVSPGTGKLDLRQYTFPSEPDATKDSLGFGKTLSEAAEEALRVVAEKKAGNFVKRAQAGG